jgi:hypothetical protein
MTRFRYFSGNGAQGVVVMTSTLSPARRDSDTVGTLTRPDRNARLELGRGARDDSPHIPRLPGQSLDGTRVGDPAPAGEE